MQKNKKDLANHHTWEKRDKFKIGGDIQLQLKTQYYNDLQTSS